MSRGARYYRIPVLYRFGSLSVRYTGTVREGSVYRKLEQKPKVNVFPKIKRQFRERAVDKGRMAESQYTIVPNAKAKAPIWKHFGVRKRNNDGSIVENTAVCLTCNGDVKTAGGTSNMNSHIKRHHPQLLTTQTEIGFIS